MFPLFSVSAGAIASINTPMERSLNLFDEAHRKNYEAFAKSCLLLTPWVRANEFRILLEKKTWSFLAHWEASMPVFFFNRSQSSSAAFDTHGHWQSRCEWPSFFQPTAQVDLSHRLIETVMRRLISNGRHEAISRWILTNKLSLFSSLQDLCNSVLFYKNRTKNDFERSSQRPPGHYCSNPDDRFSRQFSFSDFFSGWGWPICLELKFVSHFSQHTVLGVNGFFRSFSTNTHTITQEILSQAERKKKKRRLKFLGWFPGNMETYARTRLGCIHTFFLFASIYFTRMAR